MATSLPAASGRPASQADPFEVSERAAGYLTYNSSARSANEVSVPGPVRKAPLAFAGIRHRLDSEENTKGEQPARESESLIAIIITITLHAHEITR